MTVHARFDTYHQTISLLDRFCVILLYVHGSCMWGTVYPKNAHGFCFAVLCCGYTLTDFPISIRLTSLALWQSNDCPSASKATLMNMDKYFMWIHYERLHNHNKAKHNKTVCIFLGICCTSDWLGVIIIPIQTLQIHPIIRYPKQFQTGISRKQNGKLFKINVLMK